MAQTVQAYQAAPASDDWRSKLKLPPKDNRFRTEVRAPGRPCHRSAERSAARAAALARRRHVGRVLSCWARRAGCHGHRGQGV